jgi:hypothetical protein
MKNQQLHTDGAYAIWSDRQLIADSLRELNFTHLAKVAINPKTSQVLINEFVTIIEIRARELKRHDVIESLEFAALIYPSHHRSDQR